MSSQDLPATDSTCQVFALIIGVDEYKSPEVPNLKGSVNDARSMKSYLSEQLQVPDAQILFLSNGSATRDAIISGFQDHLTDNPKIKDGDTIIIFYAGHGSRTQAPRGWISSDGQIETILPHDVSTKCPNGHLIHGIPDRTVNELLRRLASAKGNNITVIFDCCNSGGLARNVISDTHLTPRFVNIPYSIPETLDNDIWSWEHARAANPKLAGFRYEAMSSHVLLAACRQDEDAYEDTSNGPVYGLFTKSLIRQLCQVKPNQVTNSDLIDSLNLTKQRPQCEGTHKNRILFNGKLVGKPSKAFRLTKKENGTLEVDAGHLQGVVCGTEFVVQDQNAGPFTCQNLGILIANEIIADSSTLVQRPGDAAFAVPERATALVLRWKNELKVFVHQDSEQQETLRSLCQMPDTRGQIPQQDFVFVPSEPEADVVIRLNTPGELQIERLDALISRYASRMTCIALENELSLPLSLNGIAHFNHHLGRHRGNDPIREVSRDDHDPLKDVTMEMYRLTTNSAGFRAPDTTVGNLFDSNRAELVLEKDAEYGFAIFNHSKHDLFPYLFYFDPSSYNIHPWYLPPASAMDPPLPHPPGPGPEPTRVTVGYGAGGGDPFEFTLKPGECSDTSFLKVFVSSSYVDMDCITQEFPFDCFPIGPGKRGAGRKKTKDDRVWGAWVAAVTVCGSPISVGSK